MLKGKDEGLGLLPWLLLGSVFMLAGQTSPDPYLVKGIQGFLEENQIFVGLPKEGDPRFAHDIKRTCLKIFTFLCQFKEFPVLPAPIRTLSAHEAANFCRVWPAP